MPAVGAASVVEFGDQVAAASAGMLNIPRLLGRVAGFAVPRFGEWCAVRLQVGHEQQVVTLGAAAPRPSRAAKLRSAAPPAGAAHPAGPRTLVAWGADEETAEQLFGAGPVTAYTAVLRAQGEPIGALTVVRTGGAEAFDIAEIALLEELTRRAGPSTGAALTYAERNRMAAALREALRPDPLPEIPGVDLGAAYRPAAVAAEIGGDFYQVYAADGDWAFDLGDVCGKGIPAAVLSGEVRQSLRTAAMFRPDPAQALAVVHQALYATGGTRFVTLLHGRLRSEPDGGVVIRLAGGGHPPPQCLRRDGTVEAVKVGGTIVGILARPKFAEATVRLEPGETLLLYTDGVLEADSPGGRLGPERLTQLLADCVGLTAGVIASRVEQLVMEHVSGGGHDDVAVLAVQARSV